MRIRNSNRVPSSQAALLLSDELEEIEVLSFSVIDEDKVKEISQQMHNDLHISGWQPHYNQPQISEKNSSTNQHSFVQQNSSQRMVNYEDCGAETEADSENVKSISLANNQEEEIFSNATINVVLVSSSSSGKAIIGSTVDKNEEISSSSSKRIRSICRRLKQSNEEADFGEDLRPRYMGKVIKTQSLESLNSDKYRKLTSSSDGEEDDNICIIDMLTEEMKRKLRGSLDKKAAEKNP